MYLKIQVQKANYGRHTFHLLAYRNHQGLVWNFCNLTRLLEHFTIFEKTMIRCGMDALYNKLVYDLFVSSYKYNEPGVPGDFFRTAL